MPIPITKEHTRAIAILNASATTKIITEADASRAVAKLRVDESARLDRLGRRLALMKGEMEHLKGIEAVLNAAIEKSEEEIALFKRILNHVENKKEDEND